MLRSLLYFALLLISACTINVPYYPINPNKSLAIDGASVVVVGVSVKNALSDKTILGIEFKKCFSDIGFVRVNKVQRQGSDVYEWCKACNSMPENMISYVPDRKPACSGDVSYLAFKVSPGDFGLGYVLVPDYYDYIGITAMTFKDFPVTIDNTKNYGFKEPSLEGLVMNYTPILSVGSGEVVYAGDIVFDFANIESKHAITWYHGNSFEGAKNYLKGTGLSDRLIFRPWTAGLPDPITPDPLNWLKRKSFF